MSNRLKNKVIFVTGAAQGIGYGVAEMCALQGAQVVIADINAATGEAAAKKIAAQGGTARFIHTDVLSEQSCKDALAATMQAFGTLTGLVNNAGWYPRATLAETDLALWERVLNMNLRSAFFCCKHAEPLMRATGGSIVNVSSVHGIQGGENLVAYAAAKGGMITLSKTLAGALAKHRIRVNALIPGWVLTEGELSLPERAAQGAEELRRMGAAQMLGRHQTPQDTAYACVYLLSDESSQVTGTLQHIDAGMSTLVFRQGL